SVDVSTSRLIRWWSKVTVEPTLFLYNLACMTTSVVEQAFFVHKSCTVNHNYNETICSHLPEYKKINTEVQLTVSDFHQWNNIAGHVAPIILSLFLGAWSDKRGRKIPLILGLLGKLYYSVMIIINATQDSWPLEYVIYTATLPSALTGGDVAIFGAAFSYMSDVTTSRDRTLRISILDVCFLSTMPTGVALGSYLFNDVTNRSYSIMFAINASMLMLTLVYSFLKLNWRTTSSQRPLREAKNIITDFFNKEHVKASVSTLTKKRPQHRRLYLWLFMVIMALYTSQRDEKPMTYLYVSKMFNWDVATYSNFKTVQSALYVISMFVGIPLMSKVLGWKDTIIIMIGATGHAVARITFAMAEIDNLFYLGAVFAAIGPVVAPVLRSMTSKVVPISERGKVFSWLSVFDNAVPLFSGVLYTQVYNASINTHPAAIFWLSMSTQVVVFVLILCVHIILGNRSLQVEEVTAQKADETSNAKTDQ
ncbi:proton-coupled folate transporter, partial [Ctenocephalides felis]|uniref:proton-coupled folate transporter n=1 Tax=Ctenocephalides felis TaxID=7515 RepID=UPI000E6E20CA